MFCSFCLSQWEKGMSLCMYMSNMGMIVEGNELSYSIRRGHWDSFIVPPMLSIRRHGGRSGWAIESCNPNMKKYLIDSIWQQFIWKLNSTPTVRKRNYASLRKFVRLTIENSRHVWHLEVGKVSNLRLQSCRSCLRPVVPFKYGRVGRCSKSHINCCRYEGVTFSC